MAPRIDTPPAWTNGHLTTSTGILVPPSAGRTIPNLAPAQPGPMLSGIIERKLWGYDLWEQARQHGLVVDKDKDTGVVILPPKGTGLDDMLNAALVDGRLANVGVSPVLSGQISGLLTRQQSQAKNSDITLSGRRSPVNKAKAAISMYNDTSLGYTGAVSQVIYQMRTFNRGAPHSTVPISYPYDEWAEYGLTAVPMPRPGETEDATHYFYLDVDWERHGSAIPYLPSIFDLEPTGDPEWPFWYCFYPDGADKRRWCLLHWSQIISVIPGFSVQPGIGTSTAWLCWDFLIDLALEKQRRAERLRHEPSNGIIAIGGVTMSGQQVTELIGAQRHANKENGRIVDKGLTVLAGKEAINLEFLSFREAPAEFEEFRQFIEDNIALLFEEPLVALVTRGGIGYGVQSDEAQKGGADAGVHSILTCIAQVLGQMYSRVQVAIIRPNDLTRRHQLENLQILAQSVAAMPPGTLTPEEVRALIPLTGLSIPLVGDGNVAEAATDDESDQETEPTAGGGQSAEGGEPTDELSRRVDALVLEAYSLLALESLDDALTGDDYTALQAAIAGGLQAQYESAQIATIVAAVRAAGIDLNEPGATEQVAEIVAQYIDSAADTTDRDALALLLLALALLGRNQAEQQALDDIDRDLTPDERQSLDDDDSATAEERVNELYVEATGEPNETQPLDDPTAAQTLDVESYAVLAALIAAAMRSAEDDSQVPGMVEPQLLEYAQSRAAGISLIEGARFYGLGMMRAAAVLGAVTKTWLPSTARNPRELHIAQYGVTVGFSEAFPSGEQFSQELWGCLCSVQVNYT